MNKNERILQLEVALGKIIDRAQGDNTKSILYAIEDAEPVLDLGLCADKIGFEEELSKIDKAYESVKDVLNRI